MSLPYLKHNMNYYKTQIPYHSGYLYNTTYYNEIILIKPKSLIIHQIDLHTKHKILSYNLLKSCSLSLSTGIAIKVIAIINNIIERY